MVEPQASSSSAATNTGASTLFKKKKSGSTRNVRPSSGLTIDGGDAQQEDDSGSSSSNVVLKRRGPERSNPLVQRTAPSAAKRARLEEEENRGLDEYDLEEEEGKDYRRKRRDRFGDSTVSSVVKAGADDAKGTTRDDATRLSNWYDEGKEKGKEEGEGEGGERKQNNDDGIYRGTSAYNTYQTVRDTGASSKASTTKGPIKTPANVRSVTQVDYQPDVCKDYKETGYCGFGDTCKFMHDRSDYLAGWQLDLLPNSSARNGNDSEEDEEEEGEEIPFACLICRHPFTDPVVTKCGHYFCQKCAIKRYAKSPKCFACGAQTQGIFNSATKILDRIEKAKKRKEEERSQRRWDKGHGVEEEEENEEQNGGELLEGVEVGRDEE